MNNDQQTSYHTRDVASGSTMTVAHPPLADAYDAACLATRAAWDRYQALEADYRAALTGYRWIDTYEALIAQHATVAHLRGRIDAAQEIWWRLNQAEHELYVQVMEWWAARTQTPVTVEG